MRAAGALSGLTMIAAREVSVRRDDGQKFRIPVAQLRVDDHFVDRPGATIATDGEVVSGHSGLLNPLIAGAAMTLSLRRFG